MCTCVRVCVCIIERERRVAASLLRVVEVRIGTDDELSFIISWALKCPGEIFLHTCLLAVLLAWSGRKECSKYTPSGQSQLRETKAKGVIPPPLPVLPLPVPTLRLLSSFKTKVLRVFSGRSHCPHPHPHPRLSCYNPLCRGLPCEISGTLEVEGNPRCSGWTVGRLATRRPRAVCQTGSSVCSRFAAASLLAASAASARY